MPDKQKIEDIARLLRHFIIASTTEAGSGHPTSSLSAVELMAVLFFNGYFRFDSQNPDMPNNDRLIFSKGHASPLFYSLWLAAGQLTETELMTMRRFGSRLEGHPTPAFAFTEAATGSLGQGLSIGVGMALNAKYIDNLPYRTFVLLGDSEMAEGSQWEALQLASYYRLGNLIGILDVNRLGQRGQTMLGHNTAVYEKRIASFGWETIVIDGHSIDEIKEAYSHIGDAPDTPLMIIARTLKGKGVSIFENRGEWHGKPLKKDDADTAIKEIGIVDKSLRLDISVPSYIKPAAEMRIPFDNINYNPDQKVATRYAYGKALSRIASSYPEMIVLDAEVGNSTYAELFKEKYPNRFFEMFVAEQNMVGTALGLSKRGKIPFVSSFAAFLTRTFDQIRMARYSDANIKFCGSHAGVSIGEDGASQMGLEDIAMFRTLLDSVVLYPSDAVSAERLVETAAKHSGIVYLRTTRKDTPVIYTADDEFSIGGSMVVRQSDKDAASVVGAGITLHEALAAYDVLKSEGIKIRVIDLYSIKPVDVETLTKAAEDTGLIITVEDHYAEGGLGEAVRSALSGSRTEIHSLAVTKMPKSGSPEELLEYEGISASAIINKVKSLLK
ncbi:MAG: transketolase [Dissulfurispiraceae bacterium]|jgi:transketolase|nr:transketolase [Dissulfurispiraceae bacterium]